MNPLLSIRLHAKHWLARMRTRIMGSHVDALLTRSYNGLLLIAPDDFSIGRQLAFEGEYNRTEIEAMLLRVRSDSRVLIVGTHVGSILVPLAKKAREVVGVEANPDTFRLLAQNIQLNGLSNVRLLSLAASDKTCQVEFQLSRTNSGGSKISPRANRPEFSYDRPKRVTVQAGRLDDAIPGETFDFVLMDIEGSEYFALRGMPNILAGAQNLVLEILPNHIENVAGVSAEEFLSAIPAEYQFTRILSGPQTGPFARCDFAKAMTQLWQEVYFGGCDVLFSKEPIAL